MNKIHLTVQTLVRGTCVCTGRWHSENNFFVFRRCRKHWNWTNSPDRLFAPSKHFLVYTTVPYSIVLKMSKYIKIWALIHFTIAILSYMYYTNNVKTEFTIWLSYPTQVIVRMSAQPGWHVTRRCLTQVSARVLTIPKFSTIFDWANWLKKWYFQLIFEWSLG